VILGFWILAAIFGNLVVPHDPLAQDLLNINQAPSGAHWFGTDQLGRDMFSRVITGSRDILITAPLATLLGTVLGTALGLVMGYFRGGVDDVVSRFVEAFLALPLVVTGILGVIALGPSDGTLIIVIGIVFTPLIARTVRAAVLQERDLDYVAAARLRGEGSLYIMVAEILPNILGPIMVEFTVRLGYAVFTIVTLSFLGFGIPPPSSNWGLEIFSNYGVLTAGYWWEVLFDALAIASLVIGVNMIANSIESTLDES
jgi:peptide/nickel transport system permease protein